MKADVKKDILIGLLAVVLTVVLIVGGYFVFFKLGRSAATLGRPVWIGDPAPAFALPQYNTDTEVTLEALRGQPVVINFFSATCATCQEELPQIAEFYRAHRQEIEFFAIDAGDSAAEVAAFVKKYKPDYPLLLDRQGEAAMAYGITGVPETVFIDPDGIIRYWIIGAASPRELAEGLKSITTQGGEQR